MREHRNSMTLLPADAPKEAETAVADAHLEASPHLTFSQGPVDQDLRPPMKPFSAKPFRAHLFTKTLASKYGTGKSSNQGKMMSDRFSTDRMAAFSPQIQRRLADIPNTLPARAAEDDGKRLVVGKQMRMKGEIAGCERLVVEGEVDATLSDVKSIEVAEGGVFKGSAEVDSAVIAGVYDGNLKVHGHLEIAATGAIKGSVSYKTIMVANGGKVEGTIELAV